MAGAAAAVAARAVAARLLQGPSRSLNSSGNRVRGLSRLSLSLSTMANHMAAVATPAPAAGEGGTGPESPAMGSAGAWTFWREVLKSPQKIMAPMSDQGDL